MITAICQYVNNRGRVFILDKRNNFINNVLGDVNWFISFGINLPIKGDVSAESVKWGTLNLLNNFSFARRIKEYSLWTCGSG